MSKWLQPVMNFNDSRILHSDGYQSIYKAFQWLLTDPSFKGLVVSLCMDKAVWNAIVNNGFMENFQELPSSGENEYPGSPKQGPDFGNIILRWILEMSLTKVVELIESFLILLNNAFHFPGKEKLTPERKDAINEKNPILIRSLLGRHVDGGCRSSSDRMRTLVADSTRSIQDLYSAFI